MVRDPWFVSAITAIGTFYFAYRTIGALLFAVDAPAGRQRCSPRRLPRPRHASSGRALVAGGLIRSIGTGAIVTGVVGFSAGFFGPMVLTPEANQGPLLGIFITGPLGSLLGGVGGAVHWSVRGRGRS